MRLTDNEIVEYYYKNIKTEDKVIYDKDRDSWFYESKHGDYWCEHSGSDVLLCMRPEAEEHIRQSKI